MKKPEIDQFQEFQIALGLLFIAIMKELKIDLMVKKLDSFLRKEK